MLILVQSQMICAALVTCVELSETKMRSFMSLVTARSCASSHILISESSRSMCASLMRSFMRLVIAG